MHIKYFLVHCTNFFIKYHMLHNFLCTYFTLATKNKVINGLKVEKMAFLSKMAISEIHGVYMMS